MKDKIPQMDYPQYRTARRLVHECCNYDNGNCILLDGGEPCVCVQSISYSLLCRWFRIAVLPLDGKLEAALLHRAERKRCTECGGYFHEKSQSRTAQAETKAYMSRFRNFQTPVNQGFFDRPQRVCGTFILYPHKSRFKCVTEATEQTKGGTNGRQPQILLPKAERELF